MIIRDNPTEGITRLYAQRLQAAEVSQREVAAPASERPEEQQDKQDKVELSAEALVLRKGVEAALSADDVRWDKVNQLRAQIQRGKYEVPIHDLARRLLGVDKGA